MGLPIIVLRNQVFYGKKTLPVVLLCGLILLIPVASLLMVRHITDLANRPLSSLDTELILQNDFGGKEAASVRTKGLMEPFNLHHFNKEEAKKRLASINGIKQYSTALVLWQFDPQNTLTAVGLDLDDPLVGMRKVQRLLTKGGHFFKNNRTDEVILERHFATLFGHKPGGLFRLAGRDLTIIGLVDFTEQSNLSNAAVFLPYETALSLSQQEEHVINQIFISLVSSKDIKSVSEAVSSAFPDFSLINRDTLYKNLSAFNQLIFKGGNFLILLVTPISILLSLWVLKMHRLEFADQTDLLRIMGWSKKDLRFWHVLDMGYLLAGGSLIAGILSLIIQVALLPHLQIGPLLDQGFQL
jgi:predicted lysophospholipase L1 biosynthesis ABC-type transport system permease subunit